MPKFRKKPVVIEAMKFTGKNADEIRAWIGGKFDHGDTITNVITIHTLEGDMVAQRGDWIIKGVSGEFYPCKPDIFAKTYEPVND